MNGVTQDFETDDLRLFLEKSLGFGLSSLTRLPGHTWSVNFRAQRARDGMVFAVKCVDSGKSDLHAARCAALVSHLDELSGAQTTHRLFPEAPERYLRYRLVLTSWCPGERRFPDQLSSEEFSRFLDDYAAFSRALQHASHVDAPDDLPGLWRAALAALSNGPVAWLGRILREEIPLADVTYRQEALRVTHGDLHHGNFHFERGRVSGFFDLEEFRYGYPAQDIMRYVICAAEHVRWYAFWRRRTICRRFALAVRRLGYSEHEWTLAIDAYFLWKVDGRIRSGRIAFPKAVNLWFRYGLYRRLKGIVRDILAHQGAIVA